MELSRGQTAGGEGIPCGFSGLERGQMVREWGNPTELNDIMGMASK